MSKKLNCIWFIVSIVLFVVLVVDCFIIKKMGFIEGISKMWTAFLPSLLLIFVTYYLPKQMNKKK